MNEIRVSSFKFGDWRDWFIISKKKRWEIVKKDELFITIDGKEFSLIAPVKISELKLLYTYKREKSYRLDGFEYLSYRVSYSIFEFTGEVKELDNNYIEEEILIKF